jgi:hypothetical protein
MELFFRTFCQNGMAGKIGGGCAFGLSSFKPLLNQPINIGSIRRSRHTSLI